MQTKFKTKDLMVLVSNSVNTVVEIDMFLLLLLLLFGGVFVRDAGPLPPGEAGDPNALHTKEPRAGP